MLCRCRRRFFLSDALERRPCQRSSLHPRQGPFSERSACKCNIDAGAKSSSRTLWKSVPAKEPYFTLGRDLSPKGPLCKCYVDAGAKSSSTDALERRPCQRISPTHSVVWPPDMRPFLITCNPTRPYWIFPNVKPCRLMILLATNSMIKIITLPSDAAMPGRMAFPSPDEIHHAISRIPPKRDQGVQMVGHDQGQLHPPTAFLVVKFHRIKQLTHHLRIRQRGLTAFFAVDRDEKCRVIRNPNRRTMRPPSGLTNGHGVMSHWKNSNCIRPMSKRILA